MNYKSKKICEEIPPIPEMQYVDHALVDYLTNLHEATMVEEFRKVYSTISYLPQDSEYNEKKHSYVLWAYMAIINLLFLFKAKTQPLLSDTNTQDWFSMNI